MSATEDLQALKALFVEASALNRQALQMLREGAAISDLEGRFKRKAALTAELQALQQEMGGSYRSNDQEALQDAFQAQREAATTESQLAEVLGKIVPQSGNAASAYDRFNVAKPVSKLDSSV